MQEKTKAQIKYLILIIMLVSVGVFYFAKRGEIVKKNEAANNLETKTYSPPEIKITNPQTFEDAVQFGAVGWAGEGSQIKYVNWKPEKPCPVSGKCYLSNITAKVIFMNSGSPKIISKNGDAYIQIANSHESNCQNPEQAAFTRYLASADALGGGKENRLDSCGESVEKNTCALGPKDAFDQTANCFSLKLYAKSANKKAINLSTILWKIIYSWSWDDKNGI